MGKLALKQTTTFVNAYRKFRHGSKFFTINSVYVASPKKNLTVTEVRHLAWTMFRKRLEPVDVYAYRYFMRKQGWMKPFDSSAALTRNGAFVAKKNSK